MNNKDNKYFIFYYGYDEHDNFTLIDELERENFDSALKDVSFSWGLPFEICIREENPFSKGNPIYRCVARSAAYAEL